MLINFYENNPNKSRGRVGATVTGENRKFSSGSPSFKKDVTHSQLKFLDNEIVAQNLLTLFLSQVIYILNIFMI